MMAHSNSGMVRLAETMRISIPPENRNLRSDFAPAGAHSEPAGSFVAALRENLRAAGRHVALGHEGPSFRDCSHPLCCDAANLVPHLQDAEQPALDAELDAIFDRVQAAVEAGSLQPDESSEAMTGLRLIRHGRRV